LANPRLGFHSPTSKDEASKQELGDRMSSIGVAAALRKLPPEVINRLDKMVVFKALGQEELRSIVYIELEMVRERIQKATAGKPFDIDISESAREFLLM